MEINYTPSPYQWQIFAFVQNGSGHGVIEAVAGSGKTTTLVTSLQLTNPTDKVAFVAFNRHIAKELEQRAPYHVHVSTLNSLGNSNIHNSRRGVQFNADKLKLIMSDMSINGNGGAIRRLVSLCKANLLDPTPPHLDYIADRWDIDVDEGNKAQVFDLAQRVFARSLELTDVIDYDDQIHLPATGRVGCEKFDILFVDEAQDLNKAQIALALNSMAPGGRIIAVGDRWQSIYGFRGADVRAIPNIIEALQAQTLPLSITYRCPLSHVKLAQRLVPHIEAREGAPEGVLEDLPFGKLAESVAPGDMVLCRCNAPLVPPALELIRQGIKAVIIGRDIGRNLMTLMRKVQKTAKVYDLRETLWELQQYADREVSKLYMADKAMRAQSLRDRVDTILALSDGCQSIGDLQSKINLVFSDDKQGIAFSTVHKAKGLEADRVFILHPEMMPHPKASKPWEQQQERNIKYVSETRSKEYLGFVH